MNYEVEGKKKASELSGILFTEPCAGIIPRPTSLARLHLLKIQQKVKEHRPKRRLPTPNPGGVMQLR
jgi:hypothetical protein